MKIQTSNKQRQDQILLSYFDVLATMNKEIASKLLKIIQETVDYLDRQLPDHPKHPNGRNPYAHIAKLLKTNLMQVIKILMIAEFQM